MKTSQGHELELVAHFAKLLLEFGDRRVIELLLPVERRRAVVSEELAGKLGVYRVGKALGFIEVGGGCFAPDQVGIRRVSQAAGDRRVETAANDVKTFDGALARQK